MKTFFFITLLLLNQASASETISKTLMKEWTQFKSLVNELKPDGTIDGYTMYREYGEMTLLWETSEVFKDSERIRFFMLRNDGTPFAITYHKNDYIDPGRVVLRRFIGPEPTGWINHTIDFGTGEYLGSQGNEPELTKEEMKMIKKWGITLF